MKVLDALTLHPKIEIIQIVQCLDDYFEAYRYIQLKQDKKSQKHNRDNEFA